MGQFIVNNPVWAAAIVIGLFILFRLSLWVFRIYYQFATRKKKVYLSVMLPREDSPKDKDTDTQKDFREKIALMDQLFRGLHEIRELSIGNRLKVMIFKHDILTFEIAVKNKLVEFYVSTNEYYADILEKQITSFYSDAFVERVEPFDLTQGKKDLVKRSFYIKQSKKYWFPIKTYKILENDPLNDLTNVLSKMTVDESVSIQMMIRPLGRKWSKKALKFGTSFFKGNGGKSESFLSKIPIIGWLHSILITLFFGYEKAAEIGHGPGADSGDSYVRMLQTEEEVAKRIGEKAGEVGFETVIRIVGAAKTKARVINLLNNTFIAFNVFKDSASNWFQTMRLIPIDRINNFFVYNNFKNRIFRIFEKSMILSSTELASIFHFPNSRYNETPVIKWLKYKTLPAPNDLSADGIILGKNIYRAASTDVRFARTDRRRHHYIIGQTGTGKSAFISSMARQDIANGDGLCVVDPHGDLIEDILQYVPKERAKDVIVFDPAVVERPMGLNILEADTPEQQDMASSQATEIFIKIFGDEIFGPRIQHYFRNGCLTLMEDKEEGATLIDVPRLFVDKEFMEYKSSKVKNPVVKSFWDHEYKNTGDRERQEMIPYFSSKFGPFITNTIMRNTIGQTKSAFDFREVMDGQKILLINLSKGKIGELNAQLLGLVIVARIQMAAMSRVDTPEKDRKDFFLYVDEFQNFATDTFASILSEARKYRLGLIMAHQYINQLVVTKYGSTSSQIRDAVFGNVGTLMSFKVGAEDAEYLAKEYAPVLTEQDIIGIDKYKAYLKLNINNATSRPFSMNTIWDETGKSEKTRDILKKYSQMKYGRKKIFVDQEISARIGIDLSADDININEDASKDDKKEEVKKPKVGEKNPVSPTEKVDLDKADVKVAQIKSTEKAKAKKK